jgi:glycosyltransferase involved in cell wall biosynthesis
VDGPEVAVVIPAHNEEATVGAVVASVRRFGIPIVVDDASTDGTARAAVIAGATVVPLAENAGYDGALNAGFLRAGELGARYVVTFDADGQHRAELISAFIDELRKSAAVVFGIRPRPARMSERVFGWYCQMRFGVRDPLCGMKAYTMDLYRSRGYFDSYGSIGTELGLFAVKRGLPFAQVDVPVTERADTPRFGQALRANWKIFRALVLSLGL